MSDLKELKEKVESLQESLNKLTDSIGERRCAESDCKSALAPHDEVFCSDCSAGADCDDCGSEINQGYCHTCHDSRIKDERDVKAGDYPHMGLPRTGETNDQVLFFLKTLGDTCCKSEPRRCSRCSDAEFLWHLLTDSLGEVRA